MKVFVLCLLALVATVSAQIRVEPCEAPREFTATSHGHDPMRKSMEHQTIFYDSFHRRERRVDTIEQGDNKTEHLDILYLHDAKKMYVLNMDTKECHERPLTHPFRPLEVQPNATFFGEFTIGTDGYMDGVFVRSWHSRDEHGGHFHTHWTTYGCLPVSWSYYSDDAGIVYANYYNVEIGIRDRTVFDPPKECTGGIPLKYPRH